MTAIHVVDRSSKVPVLERLAQDVRAGLSSTPPTLPPKWFYDEKGSLLFDEITQLEEYYPSRTEEQILRDHAPDIASLCPATTLIELGAGTSRKTRLLIEALTGPDRPLQFVPLDVSTEILVASATRIRADYPTVSVSPVVADFDDDLSPLPGDDGHRLLAFLGSTIGNYPKPARAIFLGRIAQALAPGDCLLLGADLVKSPARLIAAYDDREGVTAAFNRNVLSVLNAQLDGDIDPDDFEHVARWNEAEERMEMWLRARHPITARLAAIDFHWTLPAGGEVLTETSAKFRVPGLHTELAAAGLEPVRTWCDAADDFSVTLARR